MIENYCLSGWMANLGVVPLFLFSAFLLAPIFFLLFLRIILVCLVFEAIISSYIQKYKKFRNIVLAVFRIKVKDLAIISVLTCCNIVVAQAPIIKYIQQGEQFTLDFPKHSQYSIGSKKTLKAKVLTKRRMLLVKGLKPGLSDLIIWGLNHSQNYQIYVTAEHNKNQKPYILNFLQAGGIKYKDQGHFIKILTSIKSLREFRILNHICGDICHGELDKKLSIKLIKDVYKDFLSLRLPYIKCRSHHIKIICKHRSLTKDIKQILEHHQQKGVVFIKSTDHLASNFKVQFHLIQIESSSQEQIELGIDRLKSNLGIIWEEQAQNTLKNNPLNLNNLDLQASSIASPLIKTTINSPNSIKVGSEIPFVTTNQFSSQTQWKFAGLNLEFQIYHKRQKIFLDYEAQISSQENDQIKTHSKKSMTQLKPKTRNLLFQIDLKSSSKQKQRMSFFSRIPLLGKLFRGHTKVDSYSKILGFVQVDKI